MEIVNLLDFLNNVEEFHGLEYASCNYPLINFFDFIIAEEQFTQKFDLGLIFVNQKSSEQYCVVDGLNRLLSLSLLLHAVCECYKKTTTKNEKAIKTIRNKYLLNGFRTKLRLNDSDQAIYDKIIFGEKLSGKEKETPMFQLLHGFWLKIKEDKLQASFIFKMLNKIYVTVVMTDNVPMRDLYYSLNKDKRDIDQLGLIENYLGDTGVIKEWENIKKIFRNRKADINKFFEDFFVTKFNFREFNQNKLYEFFYNYFETMLQYLPVNVLMSKVARSALIYNKILNIDIESEDLKQAFIQIKMHKGEDTYAYILNIFEDYIDSNITEATFLEILQTIDEYLVNRLKNPSGVTFNELISYLNAFITCK